VNDGNWIGSGAARASFKQGDTIIVVYDVPKQDPWVGAQVTVDASKMGVWYGVVTAIRTLK